MRISARTDYAIRAMAELARTPDAPQKAEQLSGSQDIPLRFLLSILRELRQHRLVLSSRGPEGGYRLARPPNEISIADVIRAIDGSLASFRDLRLSDLSYSGAAASLPDVWRAVRVSLRQVGTRDPRGPGVRRAPPVRAGTGSGVPRRQAVPVGHRCRLCGCASPGRLCAAGSRKELRSAPPRSPDTPRCGHRGTHRVRHQVDHPRRGPGDPSCTR
ncbi:RrF2 family transcriptional regulator [Streptomyces mirabilis]|uniref:RrF2 family transcriptional regulator n=1 Tax=Streptomyces mirabilis TaxID=68239 RepID=UPI0036B3F2E2